MQLSDFKTYVKYDFKRTDKDTELVQFYNDMIMWVASQMPVGDYKFQSYITLTVGTEDYPLPSNLVHLIHPVRFLEGSGSNDSGYDMEHISKDEFDRLEPNPNRTSPSTGQPKKYTIYSRSILTWPIADSASYILEIDWSKRPSTVSGDSGTSSLGSEWDEVFKQGTLERLYDSLGMYQEAQYWGSKYHRVDPRTGDDMPVGLCKKLFDIERDREEMPIGQVSNNNL